MLVTAIQRFSTHDGNGVRTVVFLKGCPLRCAWCHNPETKQESLQIFFSSSACIGCRACACVCPQNAHAFAENGTHTFHHDKCLACLRCSAVCPTGALEPTATEMTVRQILAAAEKDRAFYGETGGLTLSGGEPLRVPENAIALLAGARAMGISTAVETCGYFESSCLPAVVPLTDEFLWDIKLTDPELHRAYTGRALSLILHNLRAADAQGARVLLRCILVNGVNTNRRHYEAVASLANSLSHCQGVEFLPYHTYGGSKQEMLTGVDNGRREWIPEKETILQAEDTLRALGVSVRKSR